MRVYLVDRNLPGITKEQLAAAQAAAIKLGQEMSAQGKRKSATSAAPTCPANRT
jgi:hypothetical protein